MTARPQATPRTFAEVERDIIALLAQWGSGFLPAKVERRLRALRAELAQTEAPRGRSL